MNTINLNDRELLLLVDILNRLKGDFSDHLYECDETDAFAVSGYASVTLLQTYTQLEQLEKKLLDAGREPITFSVATQSMVFESEVAA